MLFELVWTGRKSTKPYNADILQSPQLSLRLPFGLKSAPEIYVQTTNDLFGDLPGVLVYFDDFLFMGETKEKLLNNLRQVFTRQHHSVFLPSFLPGIETAENMPKLRNMSSFVGFICG